MAKLKLTIRGNTWYRNGKAVKPGLKNGNILEKAREWFYSEDASLKEIALQAFNREH